MRSSVGGSTVCQQEDEITLVGLACGGQCAPVLPLPQKSAHARPTHSRPKGASPTIYEVEGEEEREEEESEGELESWGEEGSKEEGEEGSEEEGEDAADSDGRSVDAPDPPADRRSRHASIVDRVKDRENFIRKERKALVKQAHAMD